MNHIRYLGFSDLDPALAMAIDEMLFTRAVTSGGPATLRFFTFTTTCISIGRNQRPEDLPAGFAGSVSAIVRRPTGGGAVLHEHDLCYSLVLPETFLGSSSLLASYRAITAGIKSGFRLCGREVGYGNAEAHNIHPLCFEQALDYELTLDNKKLVGSAQRRAKGILLQQGSILSRHSIGHGELIRALLEGLRSTLHADYTGEPLTGEELESAKALSRDWTEHVSGSRNVDAARHERV